MVGRRRRKTRTFGMGAILFGLAVGISMLSADQARAQGLFDAIGRLFGGGPPPRAPGPPSLDPFGFLSPETMEGPSEGGPVVAYCVRLCDGRYFPLPRNAGTPQSSADKICGAMCPATATKVYSGSQIEQATASDGSGYSKLANAFVYRERLVSDCTCTGKETTGTAVLDIHADPTLRAGDIVVTRDGPMVFKGSKQTPHRTDAFVPAKDDKGLSPSMRRLIANIRVSPEISGAPSASVTVSPPTRSAPPPPPTIGPHASYAPNLGAMPVADAFATFPR